MPMRRRASSALRRTGARGRARPRKPSAPCRWWPRPGRPQSARRSPIRHRLPPNPAGVGRRRRSAGRERACQCAAAQARCRAARERGAARARASGACHAAGGCGRAGRRRRAARRPDGHRRAEAGTRHCRRAAGREPRMPTRRAQARRRAAGERGVTRARASRTRRCRSRRPRPRGSSPSRRPSAGHASVATPKLSAVAPQGEGPAVGAALADPAPLAVALAPVRRQRCTGRGCARQRAAGKARCCAAGQRGTADAGQSRARRASAGSPPSRRRTLHRTNPPIRRSAFCAVDLMRAMPRPAAARRRAGRSGHHGHPRWPVTPSGAHGFGHPGPLILRVPD